ncbi:FAD-dependent monooxygenase [Streptomyces netropsis]
MSLHTRTRAIVVGAGIGGLATAVALRRVGVEVEVFERASELRPAGFGISVVSNAVAALRVLGIDLGLEARGQTIAHTEIMTGQGRTLRSLPIESEGDRLGAPSVAMYRGDLHAALLEGMGKVTVRTGAAATGYEKTPEGVRVRFEDGSEATGDILIGADGINSVVRRQRTGDGRPRYGGFLCWLAVTPYEHPRMTKGFNGHYWGSASGSASTTWATAAPTGGAPSTCPPTPPAPGTATRTRSSAPTPAGPMRSATPCAPRPSRTSSPCRRWTGPSWSSGATAR